MGFILILLAVFAIVAVVFILETAVCEFHGRYDSDRPDRDCL